jgi:nicotinamide riboside kinase
MISYDLYFFFEIDVPWVSDNVRDLGTETDRKRMQAIFKEELDRRNITYITVRGDWQARERIIKQAIDLILAN